MTEEETGEYPNTVECTFSLSGRDVDPDECLREIGLDTATVWRPRNERLRRGTALPNVALNFSVGPAPFESIDDAVRLVLAQVAPATDRIVACAARQGLKASMTCLIKVYTDRPLYELSPESMRAMVVLGAEFSMDLIDLRPDE